VSDKSADKSARILVRVLWQAERGSRRTCRHPRDDPRAEVGEDARVGVGFRVGVGPVGFQLYTTERRGLPDNISTNLVKSFTERSSETEKLHDFQYQKLSINVVTTYSTIG